MAVHHSESDTRATKARDPVCGMTVDTSTAKWVSDYQGTRYYFCAKGCKDTFDQHPAHHVR